MDVKTKKVPMVAALLAVLWAFGAPADAEASLPLDAPSSRVFKNADPFATAPQLDLPSLTEQLRAVEERRAAASECVSLCELAAGIDTHPFGVAAAAPPNRSEDAWGNYRFTSELTTSKNRFGYTGHYWDNESSLYYARARYYDPFTARFTQSDSFLGNIDDPPSLHRYFYGHANPTMFVDLTGYAAGDVWDPRTYFGSADQRAGAWEGFKKGYFENAADVGDSVGGFAKGVGKAGVGMVKGVIKVGAKAIELDIKLRTGTLEEKAEAVREIAEMAHGTVNHVRESTNLLARGLANPGDVLDAAGQLGISGTSEVLGESTFDAGNVVAGGYGALRGVQAFASRRAAAAAVDAAHDVALAENAARAMDAAHDAAFAENAARAMDAAHDAALLDDIARSTMSGPRIPRTPNAAMRANANRLGTYKDPLTNRVVRASAALEADHALAKKIIVRDPRFRSLTPEQQSWMLNHPINTQPLPRSPNASKGAKPPGGWRTWKGKPLHPDYIANDIRRGAFLRSWLDEQFRRFGIE